MDASIGGKRNSISSGTSDNGSAATNTPANENAAATTTANTSPQGYSSVERVAGEELNGYVEISRDPRQLKLDTNKVLEDKTYALSDRRQIVQRLIRLRNAVGELPQPEITDNALEARRYEVEALAKDVMARLATLGNACTQDRFLNRAFARWMYLSKDVYQRYLQAENQAAAEHPDLALPAIETYLAGRDANVKAYYDELSLSHRGFGVWQHLSDDDKDVLDGVTPLLSRAAGWQERRARYEAAVAGNSPYALSGTQQPEAPTTPRRRQVTELADALKGTHNSACTLLCATERASDAEGPTTETLALARRLDALLRDQKPAFPVAAVAAPDPDAITALRQTHPNCKFAGTSGEEPLDIMHARLGTAAAQLRRLAQAASEDCLPSLSLNEAIAAHNSEVKAFAARLAALAFPSGLPIPSDAPLDGAQHAFAQHGRELCRAERSAVENELAALGQRYKALCTKAQALNAKAAHGLVGDKAQKAWQASAARHHANTTAWGTACRRLQNRLQTLPQLHDAKQALAKTLKALRAVPGASELLEPQIQALQQRGEDLANERRGLLDQVSTDLAPNAGTHGLDHEASTDPSADPWNAKALVYMAKADGFIAGLKALRQQARTLTNAVKRPSNGARLIQLEVAVNQSSDQAVRTSGRQAVAKLIEAEEKLCKKADDLVLDSLKAAAERALSTTRPRSGATNSARLTPTPGSASDAAPGADWGADVVGRASTPTTPLTPPILVTNEEETSPSGTTPVASRLAFAADGSDGAPTRSTSITTRRRRRRKARGLSAQQQANQRAASASATAAAADAKATTVLNRAIHQHNRAVDAHNARIALLSQALDVAKALEQPDLATLRALQRVCREDAGLQDAFAASGASPESDRAAGALSRRYQGMERKVFAPLLRQGEDLTRAHHAMAQEIFFAVAEAARELSGASDESVRAALERATAHTRNQHQPGQANLGVATADETPDVAIRAKLQAAVKATSAHNASVALWTKRLDALKQRYNLTKQVRFPLGDVRGNLTRRVKDDYGDFGTQILERALRRADAADARGHNDDLFAPGGSKTRISSRERRRNEDACAQKDDRVRLASDWVHASGTIGQRYRALLHDQRVLTNNANAWKVNALKGQAQGGRSREGSKQGIAAHNKLVALWQERLAKLRVGITKSLDSVCHHRKSELRGVQTIKEIEQRVGDPEWVHTQQRPSDDKRAEDPGVVHRVLGHKAYKRLVRYERDLVHEGETLLEHYFAEATRDAAARPNSGPGRLFTSKVLGSYKRRMDIISDPHLIRAMTLYRLLEERQVRNDCVTYGMDGDGHLSAVASGLPSSVRGMFRVLANRLMDGSAPVRNELLYLDVVDAAASLWTTPERAVRYLNHHRKGSSDAVQAIEKHLGYGATSTIETCFARWCKEPRARDAETATAAKALPLFMEKLASETYQWCKPDAHGPLPATTYGTVLEWFYNTSPVLQRRDMQTGKVAYRPRHCFVPHGQAVTNPQQQWKKFQNTMKGLQQAYHDVEACQEEAKARDAAEEDDTRRSQQSRRRQAPLTAGERAYLETCGPNRTAMFKAGAKGRRKLRTAMLRDEVLQAIDDILGCRRGQRTIVNSHGGEGRGGHSDVDARSPLIIRMALQGRQQESATQQPRRRRRKGRRRKGNGARMARKAGWRPGRPSALRALREERGPGQKALRRLKKREKRAAAEAARLQDLLRMSPLDRQRALAQGQGRAQERAYPPAPSASRRPFVRPKGYARHAGQLPRVGNSAKAAKSIYGAPQRLPDPIASRRRRGPKRAGHVAQWER